MGGHDGWLGLIGWMSESIISPTAGDVVALATYWSCFSLHDYFSLLILIILLLDMWAIDMRCVKLSAMWIQATRATSKISHLLFPVIMSHAINRAHVLLSYYIYHALYLFPIFRYLVSYYQQSWGPVIMLLVLCTVLRGEHRSVRFGFC